MTIETINKRIEGKEKEIAKLTKKMERIRKAEASNWENNPYWYSERDIRITTRELEQAQKALDDYKAMLVAETEKAASRNIPVILEFLKRWMQRVRDHYTESLPKYLEARAEYYAATKVYSDWYNHDRFQIEDREQRKEIEREKYAERIKVERRFHAAWKWITPYIERDQLNYEKLDKDLQRDADAKYDFIIERTNEITGTITDATNLEIGFKGDLNGYIIGERGTAKVETIGAGGYAVQCFHFRTLIHKMK